MRSILGSVLLFVLALVAFDSLFLVDAGSRAAVRSPASGLRNGIGPGLHIKWPLVDRLDVVPARVTVETPVRFTTHDGRELVQTAWWLARVEDPARYADTVRKNPDAVKTAMQQALQDDAAATLSQQTLAEVLASRGEPVLAAAKQVDAAAANAGLAIQARGTANLGVPADSTTAASVQEGMKTAEAGTLAQARLDADRAVQEALAQAASRRVDMLATARAEAEAKRAAGQAEAARILAEAAADDPANAAFDRAAQAYRRARAAGRPVSLDDPAFQALRTPY